MTVKKGGGRPHIDQIAVEREMRRGTHDCDASGCSSVAHYPKGGERDSDNGRNVQGREASPAEAAANPAALYEKLAEAGRQMRELAKAKNERIRELQERAEKAEFRMYEAEARVKELEMEAKECMRAQTLAVRERPPRKGEECGG